jgi:hypothetical protein
MSTRRDVSLNVIADISKYQQQFAKIPGYTDKQAAKAAMALEKRMSKAAADSARAAERAAQKSAREFAKASEGPRGLAASLDTVAEKSGDVDSIIAGLGGALGAIDPRLQAVATGFSDAAGGIEAVSKAGVLSIPAMGAVGVAVAALGAAYLVLAHDVEEAEKKQEAAAKKALAAQSAFNGFASSIRALDVEIAKLTGSYDEIDQAAKKREQSFNRQAVQAERFLTKEIEATKAEQERLRALQRSGDASDETTAALGRANNQLSRQVGQLEAVRQRAENFREENALLRDELAERRAEEEAAKQASEDLAEADKAATRAAEQRAAAEAKQANQIRALIEAGKKRNEQVEKDLALRAQNAKLVKQATAVELSAMGRLAEATDAQLARAEEIRAQRLQNATGDNFLKLQAEEEFQAAQTAIVQHYEEKRTEIMQDEADNQAAIFMEQENNLRGARQKFAELAISSAAQSTATISRILADRGQKKRAREAFRIAKAFNIAMVTMETIRAAQGALLPPPAGFGAVLGPAAAGLIAASGAVQVAAIAMQKPPRFYRGTSMVQRVDGGAGDAVPSVLHEGEAVLNRRAADTIGRRQIDALNAGSASSPPMVVAVSQINHRQFRSFYRDDRQLPGSLTRGDRNRSGSRIGRQL